MADQKEKDPFPKGHQDIFVLHPVIPQAGVEMGYDVDARLEEAKSLAKAISLRVVYGEVVKVRQRRPATLFGKGTVDAFKSLLQEKGVKLVFIDTNLTPVQQRNLEKIWNVKILDRTSLILEIFGKRAQTAEGALQVELAALSYQKSRLVRSWTHLERQRGGLGFIGGPGESQLEMDRRLIAVRIQKLSRQLEDVKRTRELHRKARRRVPYPIVALVGYTNAGKSTLFNRLTSARVFAEDLLFATLDPTLRRVRLLSGREIILSDTVGFISDLPTQLIAAFRATLEEVLEANLIIHVRDISHSQTDQQKQDVETVLKELGLSVVLEEGALIEAFNKIDCLACSDHLASLIDEDHIPLSALTGEGVEVLLRRIDERLGFHDQEITVTLSHQQGSKLAWLYENATILSRSDDEKGIHLTARLSRSKAEKFLSSK